MENPSLLGPSLGPAMQYCAECGRGVSRRVEICPYCGCRQSLPPRSKVFGARTPSHFDTRKMLLVIVLNAVWNGLGNLVLGEWAALVVMLPNFFLVVGLFRGFPPCFLLLPRLTVYCDYQGYKFLARKAQEAARR